MSTAGVLPFVWATAQRIGIVVEEANRQGVEAQPRPLSPEMAFYRKYTEGILTRYLRMSMEAGRVPSLLGRELFRAKVTSYRVESFEDVVIFVHDVEKCLEKLTEEQHSLISRMALQSYTVEETAGFTGLRPRTVVRRYGQALDCLTRIFLSARMLETSKCCQGGEGLDFSIN